MIEQLNAKADLLITAEKPLFNIALYRGKSVIFVYFNFDSDTNLPVKQLAGAKWSQTNKAWYVPDN